MKRFIFSATALIVAATSCTESGLIDAPEFYGNAIVFDTYIGKAPMTKAEKVDVNYLKGLTLNDEGGVHLLAFEAPVGTTNPDNVDYRSAYLDGKLIWDTNHWAYQVYADEQWIPEDTYMPYGKDLALVAYSFNVDPNSEQDSEQDSLMDWDNGSQTKFSLTIPDVVSQQVDFLVTPLTIVSENASGETSVPLHFYHLLSRIGFQIQSTGGNTIISISKIKLHGRFAKSGNVDLKTAVASPVSSSNNGQSLPITLSRTPQILPIKSGSSWYVEEYSFFGDNESFSINSGECETAQQIYANPTNENNCYMMIMPGQVENLQDSADIDEDGDITEEITPYIEVKYKLGNAEPETAIIPLQQNRGTTQSPDMQNWTFEAGKAYEFIFTIATEAIEFSATVVEGGWDEQTPNPIN